MALPAPRVVDPLCVPSLRWGILGPGAIATAWASTVLKNSNQRIVAVASQTPGRAEEFAQRLGVPAWHTRYEDLVAREDVDAVYVANQPNDHARAALLALDAGKHVLAEKPFTKDLEEAGRVFTRAKEVGRLAMEAMWTRYLPQMDVARQLISDGAIGEPYLALSSFCEDNRSQERMWRKGHGSPLWDMGIYPIAFSQMFLGEPVEVVATGRVLDSGIDTDSTTTLSYANGARAVFAVSGVASSPLEAAVSGPGGVIRFESPFIFPTAVGFAPPGLGMATEWWRDDSGITRHEGIVFQVIAFADYVSRGLLESPWQSHEDSLAFLRLATEITRQLGADPY